MWRTAAGVLAGCCAALGLSAAPSRLVVCGIVVAGCVAAWRWRRRWLLGPAAGFALTALQLHAGLAERLDPGLEGQALRVRGIVASVPQGPPDRLRFRFEPDAAHGDAARRHLPRLLELTWYDAPTPVQAADCLDLEVKLRRPRGFANPGGRDNAARLLREGIGATGYVRAGTSLGRSADAARRYPVLLARAAVAAEVRSALGQRPAAGIVAGLAVGLQDALSREQWQTLARSGTSHLMAISGLHIAMVAIVAGWLGGRLQRLRQRRGSPTPQRDVAVLAGSLAALGYSLLAGWSVPTQRTMVMIALGAVALLLRRRLGVADGIGLCVLGVLLLDPLAPLAPGFWLSFGAVAAILYGASGYLHAPGRWRGYLAVQGAVTLGLAPVLAASFGAVSIASVLVNLYAIPLYTLLVVPAVLLSCAVAAVAPAAGHVALDWTGRLVEWTWPLIEVPAQWSWATWPIAAPDAVSWLALLLGTGAALSPLPRHGRIAGLVLVAVGCAWQPAPVAAGAARVTVLDVGQGLAVVVETRRHALVYDAGPSFRSGSDAGQLVLVPFLHARGIRALDRLVVSHDDDDHKGGAGSVTEALRPDELVLGPGVTSWPWPGAVHEPRRAACRRGDGWTWDGVEFYWLHPAAATHARDNDNSCVLLVRAGTHTLLLTGDIEADAERELLRAGLVPRVDVVVAPHHGSRTSSTPEFVARVRPHWVVYSAGHRNRWNFPLPPIVERWESAGAASLLTSSGGAIRFDLEPGRPLHSPAEWRREHPRPWRDP